ncbi:MAG: extracellular solute-binding protein [Clostridiales bacterium]|nr:extracellular solute-binding protein [Clostridiales bacterium]MDO4351000.1 extracellular solute-binding protein [Eubacteriales bacterium]MDY4009180.1 extracellular solute-binding protein [Candidatus Limiplasma sp.]
MKKWLALLLAAMMLLGSTAAVAEIGTAEAPVPVSILIKDVAPDDADTIAVVEAIEKGMAAQGNYVDITILEAPAGKYIEVVPLAFRTGEINPDLIFFQGNTDTPVIAEGLLEDLTPYVEASTNVKAVLGEHSKARLASSPYLLWLAPAKFSAPVMRADFLDKAASKDAFLADPTPEAYAQLLKDLMDAGVVKYGTTVDGGLARLDSIFNHAFGVTGTLMQQEDGSYVYSMVTEQEKNKLAFYAQLYKDGILDADYITKAWDTMEQAFYEGVCALIAGTAGDVIQVYNTKMVQTMGEAAELVALPPAKGVGQAYASIDVTKEERGFAINATIEQNVKDAAFAILEYMASPEGRMIDKLGVEGKHYTISDGVVTFTEDWGSYWARFFPTVDGLPADLKLATPVLSTPAQDSLTLGAQFYANDVNVIIPEDLQPQLAAVKSIYTEYANEIVRGVRPVEDFAEMVEKFNAAGGDQLNEYINSVLK